ncbi:hypothetical protein SNEBB_008924 [Seison nebaliae]|nr:hypothetical protein SNEBB_008924 [Seison nebaliae]
MFDETKAQFATTGFINGARLNDGIIFQSERKIEYSAISLDHKLENNIKVIKVYGRFNESLVQHLCTIENKNPFCNLHSDPIEALVLDVSTKDHENVRNLQLTILYCSDQEPYMYPNCSLNNVLNMQQYLSINDIQINGIADTFKKELLSSSSTISIPSNNGSSEILKINLPTYNQVSMKLIQLKEIDIYNNFESWQVTVDYERPPFQTKTYNSLKIEEVVYLEQGILKSITIQAFSNITVKSVDLSLMIGTCEEYIPPEDICQNKNIFSQKYYEASNIIISDATNEQIENLLKGESLSLKTYDFQNSKFQIKFDENEVHQLSIIRLKDVDLSNIAEYSVIPKDENDIAIFFMEKFISAYDTYHAPSMHLHSVDIRFTTIDQLPPQNISFEILTCEDMDVKIESCNSSNVFTLFTMHDINKLHIRGMDDESKLEFVKSAVVDKILRSSSSLPDDIIIDTETRTIYDKFSFNPLENSNVVSADIRLYDQFKSLLYECNHPEELCELPLLPVSEIRIHLNTRDGKDPRKFEIVLLECDPIRETIEDDCNEENIFLNRKFVDFNNIRIENVSDEMKEYFLNGNPIHLRSVEGLNKIHLKVNDAELWNITHLRLYNLDLLRNVREWKITLVTSDGIRYEINSNLYDKIDLRGLSFRDLYIQFLPIIPIEDMENIFLYISTCSKRQFENVCQQQEHIFDPKFITNNNLLIPSVSQDEISHFIYSGVINIPNYDPQNTLIALQLPKNVGMVFERIILRDVDQSNIVRFSVDGKDEWGTSVFFVNRWKDAYEPYMAPSMPLHSLDFSFITKDGKSLKHLKMDITSCENTLPKLHVCDSIIIPSSCKNTIENVMVFGTNMINRYCFNIDGHDENEGISIPSSSNEISMSFTKSISLESLKLTSCSNFFTYKVKLFKNNELIEISEMKYIEVYVNIGRHHETDEIHIILDLIDESVESKLKIEIDMCNSNEIQEDDVVEPDQCDIRKLRRYGLLDSSNKYRSITENENIEVELNSSLNNEVYVLVEGTNGLFKYIEIENHVNVRYVNISIRNIIDNDLIFIKHHARAFSRINIEENILKSKLYSIHLKFELKEEIKNSTNVSLNLLGCWEHNTKPNTKCAIEMIKNEFDNDDNLTISNKSIDTISGHYIPYSHSVNVLKNEEDCYELKCLITGNGLKFSKTESSHKIYEWSDWSSCSHRCGIGKRERNRQQTTRCNRTTIQTEKELCVNNCGEVEERWSEWSECISYNRTFGYQIRNKLLCKQNGSCVEMKQFETKICQNKITDCEMMNEDVIDWDSSQITFENDTQILDLGKYKNIKRQTLPKYSRIIIRFKPSITVSLKLIRFAPSEFSNIKRFSIKTYSPINTLVLEKQSIPQEKSSLPPSMIIHDRRKLIDRLEIKIDELANEHIGKFTVFDMFIAVCNRQICSVNEHMQWTEYIDHCLSQCHTRCRESCESLDVYEEGCTCQSGFSMNDEGRCIPEVECGCPNSSNSTYELPNEKCMQQICNMVSSCYETVNICDNCEWSEWSEWGSCQEVNECEWKTGRTRHRPSICKNETMSNEIETEVANCHQNSCVNDKRLCKIQNKLNNGNHQFIWIPPKNGTCCGTCKLLDVCPEPYCQTIQLLQYINNPVLQCYSKEPVELNVCHGTCNYITLSKPNYNVFVNQDENKLGGTCKSDGRNEFYVKSICRKDNKLVESMMSYYMPLHCQC